MISRAIQTKKNIENKKNAESKALAIVEKLCESTVTEEHLLSIVPNIRQTHYDDIVEERSLIKLCGYPLCSNTLKEVASKQYYISRKTNKVYDITERKKYCSNQCYKSSKYFGEQLLTSPVWINDESVPQVSLLPLNNKGLQGIELEFGHVRLSETEKELDKLEQTFLRTEHLQNDEMVLSMEKEQNKMSEMNLLSNKEQTRANNILSGDVCVKESISVQYKMLDDKNSQDRENSSVIKTRSKKKILLNRNEDSIFNAESAKFRVENILKEWITADTFTYLGVCEGVELDEVDASENKCTKKLKQEFEKLCRKLTVLEMQENLVDEPILTQNENEDQKVALTKYEGLRKEMAVNIANVRAFYNGQEDYLVDNTTEEPNLKSETEEPKINTVIPIVDSQAQDLLRRQIVLDRLNNVYLQMQDSLGLERDHYNPHLRELVASFRLTANNIVLKPAEWLLVGIILLHLLSRRKTENRLNHLLSSEKTKKVFDILLQSMEKDTSYVREFVNHLLENVQQ